MRGTALPRTFSGAEITPDGFPVTVWLLPLFSPISRGAAAVYYRVRYAGEKVPPAGPVLLVANHPNSLLDPMLVVAAARRPVRFLAKAPLFTDRYVGWLIRAAGAIPVYRRVDDPTQMERNEDTFRAVHDALAAGAAVGIFPEGVSHSEPSMVPLKTGAARIAFGASALTGTPIPIVPIGLVLRQKDVFRSDALAFIGGRVAWDDLAARGAGDAAAVRELTDRIADALRRVTVNLEHWEDRPVVECAVRVWEAERGAPLDPAERVVRLDLTTRILAEVRRTGDEGAAALARDVASYDGRLRRLRLRPSDLVADVSVTRGVRWAAARLHLLMPVAVVASLAGLVLFWPPYRATGWIVQRLRLEVDVRSTYKLLIGIPLYALWLAALAASVVLLLQGWVAVVVAVAVPVLGMVGLLFRERWRAAWADARRFLLLRSRRALVTALRERQRDLGERLDELQREYLARGVA